MDNEDSSSDKRASQGSAGWRLTSLWRPVSQSILPRSNRSSTQTTEQLTINFPHFSLSIPSLALDRFGDSRPISKINNGSATLLLDTQGGDIEVKSDETEKSPSDQTDDFRSAHEEVVMSRPPTAFSITTLPAYLPLGDHESIRPLSTISINSRLARRPESRDTRYLAELPGISAEIKTVKANRPTVLQTSKLALSEKPALTPPPVPLKNADIKTDCHVVTLAGTEDPANAVNWPTCGRWVMTLALGFTTFCVALASSITSAATTTAASHFGVDQEIMTLATSLFMLGIAVGSFVWTPFHTILGRKPTLLFGLVGFTALNIPVAVAKNVETVLVCRFFAGVFGCSPLVAVVAAISDVWTQLDRGLAMSVFSGALVVGTACGPLVGGPITQSEVLGWRWPSYIVIVLCFPFAFACSLIYRESSSSILLKRRAKELRRSTGDWALHSIDEESKLTLGKVMVTYLGRPLLMLVSDPLLLFPTMHMSFAYGVLYLLLETYSESFTDRRGWPLELSGLPFAAVIGGVLLGCLINLMFSRIRLAKIYKKYGRFTPEERLLPMAIGGICLPIGLFLSGWTSKSWMTPAPEIIAGVPLGAGILLICLQGNNYLLDAYTTKANAPIAISTAVRSLFAAGFSAFARPMYDALEPQWASTILGGIAAMLVLIPLLFYRYGVKLRAMSAFTPKLSSGFGDSPTQGVPVAAASV